MRSPMTCIIRVGSTSCVPGSSVGSGRRAGWKPCISVCCACGCSGAATPSSCAPPPSSSPPSSASSSASPPPSLISGTSSPSPWINAIASPTGTSWPSLAISCASVPSSSASSSIVTLSVSISAIGSPSETSSPSLLSHWRRVPSSIASPILGIMTSGTLLLLLVQNPAGRVGNLLLAGEGHQFKVARVRSGDLGAAYSLHGSVERVEGPILDDRRHLARHPEPPPLLLDGHGPVRLLNGLDDSVLVERPQGSQVYDLSLEAVFGECVRGPQAQVDLAAVCDERHVQALAGDAG